MICYVISLIGINNYNINSRINWKKTKRNSVYIQYNSLEWPILMEIHIL